ncbi:outer membrane protein [Labrys sp. ZIDIC5]|uniref:outer membrane protein n=1 Tax=Labrys sedimenti TaxID=3106036 RepID=UPI002ACAA799|nr:outer membrane protein [Labrys sp. ZIDIC5]MDZ5448251.1 outer membrane protein [Labrys sp. ZIDIC5]
MRTICFAIAGLSALLCSTSVYAADLAAQAVEPVPPVVTPYNWSGPYVGLHAGYGWGRENDDQSKLFPTVTTTATPVTTSPPADKFDLSGFVGGAHAGYNYQINEFVIGVEGDIDYSNLNGSAHALYNGNIARTLKLKTEWQGSARARIGYAFDNILVYATGGLALANAKLSTAGADSSNTHVGWTVGLGAEYAFTQNWIGRLEVRYSDFNKKSYATPDGRVKADWNQTTVTAGISYKF